VIAVPLVLLGAGHLKDDGPAALARARRRHPGVSFSYARDLGLHPDVLAVAEERARAAVVGLPDGVADALAVVGRGSSDPDANADLVKAGRLLADGRGLTEPLDAGRHGVGPPPLGLVVEAFVSLARPDVASALDRCEALGARRIAVVPYFLFEGVLVDRIRDQVASWCGDHPASRAVVASPMGIDPRLVALAWQRYDEAVAGPVHMNCDGCLHRVPLPGYEHRVGAPPFG
jgi:sirohydrochlorin ferrochelatase